MRLISSESKEPKRRRGRLETQKHVDRVRCVLRHERKYLLVQHYARRMENYDKWRLPGGRLKPDEEPKGGIRRELVEEIGVRVVQLAQLGDWSHRHKNQRVFGCEIERAVTTFNCEEIRSIGWFTYADVRELAATDLLHTGFELAAIREFRRRFPS